MQQLQYDRPVWNKRPLSLCLHIHLQSLNVTAPTPSPPPSHFSISALSFLVCPFPSSLCHSSEIRRLRRKRIALMPDEWERFRLVLPLSDCFPNVPNLTDFQVTT